MCCQHLYERLRVGAGRMRQQNLQPLLNALTKERQGDGREVDNERNMLTPKRVYFEKKDFEGPYTVGCYQTEILKLDPLFRNYSCCVIRRLLLKLEWIQGFLMTHIQDLRANSAEQLLLVL